MGAALSDRTLNQIIGRGDRTEDAADRRVSLVGVGAVCQDLLAYLPRYPKRDEKARSTSFKMEGGGNCGNVVTAFARLLNAHRPEGTWSTMVVSKVGDDATGRSMRSDLEAEGVDCRALVTQPGATSPFTYIICDAETTSRTCIHTPLDEPLRPDEISSLDGFLDEVRRASLVYSDGRHTETAIAIAEAARQGGVPVLVDAEKPRPLLDDLLALADVVIAPESFLDGFRPEGTDAMRPAVAAMCASALPRAKLVIITRGTLGSVAFAHPNAGSCVRDAPWVAVPEPDAVDALIDATTTRSKDATTPGGPGAMPALGLAAGSQIYGATADGGVALCTSARLSSDVADTTGAGDAFIAAVGFAIACTPEAPLGKVMAFASAVAACKCTALGARSGLPQDAAASAALRILA